MSPRIDHDLFYTRISYLLHAKPQQYPHHDHVPGYNPRCYSTVKILKGNLDSKPRRLLGKPSTLTTSLTILLPET